MDTVAFQKLVDAALLKSGTVKVEGEGDFAGWRFERSDEDDSRGYHLTITVPHSDLYAEDEETAELTEFQVPEVRALLQSHPRLAYFDVAPGEVSDRWVFRVVEHLVPLAIGAHVQTGEGGTYENYDHGTLLRFESRNGAKGAVVAWEGSATQIWAPYGALSLYRVADHFFVKTALTKDSH